MSRTTPIRKSRRGKPWTAAEIAKFGRVPDSVLARRLHRSIKEVVAERERRRIALPMRHRRWTAREVRLLGTMNDYELARRLRRPNHQVHCQRRALNIPPFKPRSNWRYWKPAEMLLLGTMPDEELATQLGRTCNSIQVERIRRGIPSFTPKPKWTSEHLALLGKAPDREIARLTGRSLSAVSSMRRNHTDLVFKRVRPARPPLPVRNWTEEEKEVLGKLRTAAAAARFGLPAALIRQARRELGIQGPTGRPWTSKEEAILGTMPDQEVENLGCRKP